MQQRTQALVNASAKEQAYLRKHQSRSGKAPIVSENKTQAAALSRNCKDKHTSLKRRAASWQHLMPTRQHHVARNEGIVYAPNRQPSLNLPV